ncbi:hypothetical protein [Burkholderia sp. Bp8986]|uniref:hypothetical protein n=1 Tax=Burkholderia sp. Bp8986 TaxID=2184550 RepID=UPI000F5AFDF6|nr:hypothetical protein [Burkholderia sp. Bp8986]
MSYPEHLREFFSNGGALHTLVSVSDSDVENMYACAYKLLGAGNAFQAGALFTALTWLDHHEIEYWLGLSIAQRMMGQHAKALASLSNALRCPGSYNPSETRALRLMVSSLTILGNVSVAERAAGLAAQMESLATSVSKG